LIPCSPSPTVPPLRIPAFAGMTIGIARVLLCPLRIAISFGVNDVFESTTKFGMLRSTLSLFQALPNACDVSSTRPSRPDVVTSHNVDQEV
jgi:hypothetical protein